MVVALPTPHDLLLRVQGAMTGSKSGSVSVISQRVYTGDADALYESLSTTEKDADLVVVVCPKYHGSLRAHSALAQQLRSQLTKVADTLALQARRGAAAQYPISGALFDVVVGFRPPSSSEEVSDKGSLVILLPEEGLESGLSHVRGLLKHALATARGDIHRHSQ